MTPSAAPTVTDHVLTGPHGPLRVRGYRPAEPRGPGLVWAHGGGFAGGDLDMPEAHAVASALAASGIAVVSVDYRLAPMTEAWALRLEAAPRPGVHFPVPHDEVTAAFRWAVASGLATDGWAIGGASAGANLAAGAALRLSRGTDPRPTLAVLAYPTLHAVQDAPGPELRALLDADPAADVFRPDFVLDMYENYIGGPVRAADVHAIPGTATADDLRDFPATIIVNSETDELRMSGEAFGRTLAAVGIEVAVHTEPGTTHGHLNRPAEAAFAATIARLTSRILPPR
ncbi:alpha/beta hydrolase [Microbacterium paraoxydans]|uniref:alpha/beta hydrolase n=1 Tax=Microbacterium paraoxydans TaxID=199592 RepID=UPI0030138672